jgi:uncharacterized protein (DUF2252 family)
MSSSSARRAASGLLCMVMVLSGCAAPPIDPVRAGVVDEGLRARDGALPADAREEKHDAMAKDALAFFRGTPWLFWRDHGADPRLQRFGGERATSWIVGDLHVENMGAFEDARPEVVFGVNDYDEAVIADVQLDVWRLAASVVLLCRRDGRVDDAGAREGVKALALAWLDALEAFRGDEDERGFRVTAGTTYGALADLLVETELEGRRTKLLDEWTSGVGRRLDRGTSKLAPAPQDVAPALKEALAGLAASKPAGAFAPGYFELEDVALRLHAGTASLGRPRYYALVRGPSEGAYDDRLLDVKQQVAPCGPAPEGLLPGERAAAGQQAMAPWSDPHLGAVKLPEGSFTVRERSPYRADPPLGKLSTTSRLVKLCELWGWVAAAAHASGDEDGDPQRVPRSIEDEVVAAVGKERTGFADLVATVAFEVADQAARDHVAFVSGR